jgi:SAM-dependent methyltransferase
MAEPDPIIADTKDWTWVLERPCLECGFDAAEHSLAALPGLLHDSAMVWSGVLSGSGAAHRPAPHVWSPLEYACHVRDVHRLFAERVRLMLEQDDPDLPSWDQDRTARESRYAEQDPATVDAELVEAAGHAAGVYATVGPESAGRRATRSDGSRFTVETLGIYHLHDVLHHVHDVRGDAVGATIRAYDDDAAAYREATAELGDGTRAAVTAFAARLGSPARVLEIGSGGGRDALALEEAGVQVRRTDITPGFVRLLREAGHEADVIDPLHDDLGAPGAYDGVWASACLIHVDRADLPTVVRRLAVVTRHGGLLHLSVKAGDGEGWSTHGSIGAPRRFVYWREEPLRRVLEGAEWQVDRLVHRRGHDGEPWLEVEAVRT